MAGNTHEKPKRRRGPGRPWPKGVSGNPDGLPPLVVRARALALSHAPRAVEKLAELLENQDPRVALAAAEGLLDRAGVRPVALDDPGRGGEGAVGTTIVVQLAIPTRETPPSFLGEGRSVTALPAPRQPGRQPAGILDMDSQQTQGNETDPVPSAVDGPASPGGATP